MPAHPPKSCATSAFPGQSSPTVLGEPGSAMNSERKSHSQPAYQWPPPPPTYIISEEHDSPLDTRLNLLAFALFEFDFKFLEKVRKSIKKPPTQDRSPEAVKAEKQLKDFNRVLEQRKNIQNGTSGFARSYITDRALVQFWNRAFQLHKKTLSSSSQNDNVQNQFERRLSGYISSAVALEKAIFFSVGEGLFSEEIEEAIAARWRNLDSFLEWYLRNPGRIHEAKTSLIRTISSWQVISIRIREMRKTSALSQKGKLYSYVSLSSKEIISPIILSSLILAFGACLSTGIFAVGYSKSPHRSGSVQDADFWFSTQASIAQMTCLISSTLVTWKSSRALTWHWLLPAGIASFCTFSTAPLYIFAPTEWALFSAFVAAMLQSVLVLYPIFFTSSENQEEQDKKFK